MYEIEENKNNDIKNDIEENTNNDIKIDKNDKDNLEKGSLIEKMNRLTTDKTENKDSSNKKSGKRDDCQELRNLEYKNMLMYGNNINPKEAETATTDVLDDFLKKETAQNKLEQWAKLDKTGKISKLRDYSEKMRELHKLTDAETTKLNTYLLFCLERKYFVKVKDVNYDREKGILVDIPNLCFIEESRQFSYRKSDKSNSSTLKSLAPKKNRTQKY